MATLDLGQVVGPPGPQGEVGPQGEQGIQGPMGPAATINDKNAVTIKAGEKIALDQTEEDLTISCTSSNQSLIINGDFRRPVNRQGKKEYTGHNVPTIDNWWILGTSNSDPAKVTVNDGYITIECSSQFALRQYDYNIIEGETYTFSMLLRSGELVTTQVIADATAAAVEIGNWAIRITNTVANRPYFINIRGMFSSVDLIAAKVDPGLFQTLAHKEGDTWVLNDPINYELQYALCSQYSPTTGEWVGVQHSNPNLLDNWYFLDPANQRQITVIENTGRNNYYTIDRWISARSQFEVSNGVNIKFVDTGNAADPKNAFFAQFQEGNSLIGKLVTLSILYNENKLLTRTLTFPSTSNVEASQGFNEDKISLSLVFDSVNTQVRVRIQETDAPVTLIAAKLELGPIQTLAHKEGDTWVLNDPPPNKAVELLKCQRYYRRWSNPQADNTFILSRSISTVPTNTKWINWNLSVTPAMRANPSFTCNGLFVRESGSVDRDPISYAPRLIAMSDNILTISVQTESNRDPLKTYVVGLEVGGYLEANADL